MKENLSSNEIIRNAAKVTVESAITLYAQAVYALLEAESQYSEVIFILLSLLEQWKYHSNFIFCSMRGHKKWGLLLSKWLHINI